MTVTRKADQEQKIKEAKLTVKAEQKQLVVFNLGNEEYGIDIELTKEIIKLSNITPVPNTEEYVPGVINLRGQIIPVLDLHKRFGLEQTGYFDQENKKIIIVEVEESLIGLIVDRVKEITWIEKKLIKEAPEVAGGIKQEFLEGVCSLNEQILIVIDIYKTLFTEVQNQKS